ncbi:MAG: hypothetical protein HY471_02985 [Candidatus Sungbacteria bacterium]|nr:hypothetical protein [Candidatus Sungbacteria bacterium]
MLTKVLTLFEPGTPLSIPTFSVPRSRWLTGAGLGVAALAFFLNILLINAIIGAQFAIKSLQTDVVQIENAFAENQAQVLLANASTVSEEALQAPFVEIGSNITYIFGNPPFAASSR